MNRIPTVEVCVVVLKSMYRKFDIWRGIKNGELVNRVVYNSPSHSVHNGTSQIVKHFTTDWRHIATTHRIRDSSGRIVHWDAKDIRIGGVCYWIYKY
jgi:hypothetical protein